MTDITPVLDHLCDLHGFSSRDQARKWLREAIDTIKRARLTHGFPLASYTELDVDVRNGEVVFAKTKKGITIENPQRNFIGADGYILPAEQRPDSSASQIPDPEAHVPQEESLFQRALREREGMNAPGQKKYRVKKPKATQPAQSAQPRRKFQRTPRAKQIRPNEGTQAREIFDRMTANGWDHIATRNEMVADGHFNNYPDKKRNQQSLAAVLSVKYRYGPPKDQAA